MGGGRVRAVSRLKATDGAEEKREEREEMMREGEEGEGERERA